MGDHSFSILDWPGWEYLIRKDPDMGAAARSLFRSKRLRKIAEGKEPVKLEEGRPRVVVHIMPNHALEPAAEIDLYAAGAIKAEQMWPMHANSCGPVWPNFDGLINVARDASGEYSYVQLFHDGTVEAVNASMIRKRDDVLSFTGSLFEREVFNVVLKSAALQKQLGVEPPVFITVSLLGVRGFTIRPDRDRFSDEGRSIDRDDLLVPEVAVENYDVDKNPAMRRIFNRVWNAAGWDGSPNFKDGEWILKS